MKNNATQSTILECVPESKEKMLDGQKGKPGPNFQPVFVPTINHETAKRLLTFIRDGRFVEVEIGCGKGKYVTARAQNHPEINFVAVERLGKWLKIGEERARKRNLTNLLFLKADAREMLRDYIPSQSIDVFHVYFPDPWPKRKQRRRRIVNTEFLSILYDRLRLGGAVYLATDDEDYFFAMKKSVQATNLSWSMRESRNVRFNPAEDFNTNYEMKYRAAGKDLFYLELRKS